MRLGHQATLYKVLTGLYKRHMMCHRERIYTTVCVLVSTIPGVEGVWWAGTYTGGVRKAGHSIFVSSFGLNDR